MSKSDKGLPPVPKDISGSAKTAFKRLRKLLAARGTITRADSDCLSLYVFVFDRARRARVHLAEDGEVLKVVRLDSHGKQFESAKLNPWLKIAQDSERQALVCLQQLGLTPKTRGDIKPPAQPDDADDVFTMLLEESAAEWESKNKTVQ